LNGWNKNDFILKTMGNFLKWNKALVDYYFINNNQDEIIIDVDNELLDKIGEENKIGNHKDFYRSVIVDVNSKEIVDLIRLLGLLWDNSIIKKNNLLSFAEYLSIKKVQNYPILSFNYVVLAIIAYDGSNNYSDCLKQLIGKYLNNDNSNHNTLEKLFDGLHKFDKRFINRRLNKQRYVGLIKFQVVLNSRERQELEDILFKYRIRIEDSIDIDYNRIALAILKYIPQSSSLRAKIISSLNDNFLSIWFINKIVNFNDEKYKAKFNNEIVQFTNIEAAFAYSPNYGKLMLFSNRRIDEDIKIENFILQKTGVDIVNGYYLPPISSTNQVEFKRKELKCDNVSLQTVSLKEVNFLQYHSGYYIQTTTPIYDCKTLVVVKNEEKIKVAWEKWAKDNTSGFKNALPILNTAHIFGNDWLIYDITSINNSYFKQNNNDNDNIEKIGIRRIGGITHGENKQVYLINGMPFYELNQFNSKSNDIKVKIKRNQTIDNSIKFEIKGNHLFLKLSDFNLHIEDTDRLEIEIKCGSVKLDDDFLITSVPTEKVEDESLFKYNKWGENINEVLGSDYSIGNKVKIKNEIACTSKHEIKHTIDELRIEKFQIINLLASMYFSKKCCLNDRDIEKAIKYVSITNQIESLDTNKIKWSLISLGYLNQRYNDKKIAEYQINPPMFLRIGRSFTFNGEQVYMLVGGYTQLFLQKLKFFCENNNIRIKFRAASYHSSENSDTSIYNFLPDTIYIDHNMDFEKFRIENNLYFEVCKEAMTDAIITFLPSISEFESHFLNSEKKEQNFNIELKEPDRSDFPRIRESKSLNYYRQTSKWIEISEGKFYKIRQNMDWIDLYVKYKHKECVMLMCKNPGVATLYTHIYMPVGQKTPFLLKKALIQFNGGIGTYTKFFQFNNMKDNDMLYSAFIKYNVSSDRNRRNQIAHILTGVQNYENNGQIKNYFKEYYKWKIELMYCTEPFCQKGWKEFLMIYNDNKLMAVATKSRVFINDEKSTLKLKIKEVDYSGFKEIKPEGTINNTISLYIREKLQEQETENKRTEIVDIKEDYKKQELTIIY